MFKHMETGNLPLWPTHVVCSFKKEFLFRNIWNAPNTPATSAKDWSDGHALTFTWARKWAVKGSNYLSTKTQHGVLLSANQDGNDYLSPCSKPAIYPSTLQLDWTSCADTQKNNLPRDREGYGGFEYTDEKLSTRRIQWCGLKMYIFFFWRVILKK